MLKSKMGILKMIAKAKKESLREKREKAEYQDCIDSVVAATNGMRDLINRQKKNRDN